MNPEEKSELVAAIVEALGTIKPEAYPLSDEELAWVRLAIQKEAQSIKLRQAIIEKTISSLAWSACLGLFYILVEWATRHGFKP